MRRYARDQRIRGGKVETAKTVKSLRRAKDLGLLTTTDIVLTEDQRLDHLAHEHLGNSRWWWVLAALSDIGWGLQIPAGTIIKIPLDISVVKAIVG